MPQDAEDPREAIERYEKQVDELQTHIKFLEDEIGLLRRRLHTAPRQVRVLEERLLESKGEVARALSQNEKLVGTLRSEREKIEALKEEVEKLTKPPASFGVMLDENDDGSVDVFTAGRKMRVNVDPELDRGEFRRGAEVILNEALNVVAVLNQDRQGEGVTIKELLDDDRVVVVGRGDEEAVAIISQSLRGVALRAGDPLLFDPRSGHVLERLPKEQVEELILEEIPDVSYEDIGGLASQIEDIKDAVELPFLYAELFKEHDLTPPKGVLLYGPPGCGKTLIAKAVAHSLAEKVAEKTGRRDAHSYFLNVKGPELLNKYVGETERQIRLIFQRAKEKSEEGFPVIVFFDEMDSIFRTRGSGVSSDLPLHADEIRKHGSAAKVVEDIIDVTVHHMYDESEGNRFLEVTYANGDKEILYFKDFNSGAMIENVVARAKKMAIKRYLDEGQKGLKEDDLL